MIPGVGGGFYNDQNHTIFDVGNSPGPMFVGNFNGSLDLLTVNSGSNDLTLITDFTGSSRSPGHRLRGLGPGGGAVEFSSGSGFDNLIVANNGDGTVALPGRAARRA